MSVLNGPISANGPGPPPPSSTVSASAGGLPVMSMTFQHQHHNDLRSAFPLDSSGFGFPSSAAVLKQQQHLTGSGSLLNESEFPSLGDNSNVFGTIRMSDPLTVVGGAGAVPFGHHSSLASSSSTVGGQHFGLLPPLGSGAAFAAGRIPQTTLSPAKSNYANLMKPAELAGNSHQHLGTKEFHIQSEDFPALPGSEDVDQQQNSVFPGSTSRSVETAGQLVGASANGDGVVAAGPTQQQIPPSAAPQRGIITFPGGKVTNVPPQMLNDQFGMVGLLASLRAIYTDQRVVSLTLGQDMTTLGLDLNNPEKSLYPNFGGPWCDGPSRLHDVECNVPAEYVSDAAFKAKLKGPVAPLNRLSEDSLFYLFYNVSRQIYQMAAAVELYTRDWRYHKVEKVWLTRQNRLPLEQLRTYERGVYAVFDPSQWRKVSKEMKLEYSALEDRPKFSYQQQQANGEPAAQQQPPIGTFPAGGGQAAAAASSPQPTAALCSAAAAVS